MGCHTSWLTVYANSNIHFHALTSISLTLSKKDIDSLVGLVDSTEHSLPFTLYPTGNGDKITKSLLEDFREDCLENDDIFQPAFLEHFVFYGADKSSVELQPSVINLLASWNTQGWTFAKEKVEKPRLDSGPYVGYRGNIWEPWRIYTDDYLTMTQTFKPAGNPGTG
jgi:hypothetical protein